MPTYQNPNPDLMGDVQAAIAAGAALGEVRGIPEGARQGIFTVVPKDYEVRSLEEFLPRPQRIAQNVVLHDTDSFIAYVNEFAKQGVSHIFFDGEQEQFTAVLDYHEKPDTPNWCDHTATFRPRRSLEFAAWMNQNGKQMSQIEFGRFLESNAADVIEPAGAELLETALALEAKTSVTFSSAVRLATGQTQLQYDEEIRGTAKRGTLEVPEQFVLGIPIHIGGPAYKIPVRLRWRLHEGRVLFWFEIVRPHKYIDHATHEIQERIAKETSITVLAGVAK